MASFKVPSFSAFLPGLGRVTDANLCWSHAHIHIHTPSHRPSGDNSHGQGVGTLALGSCLSAERTIIVISINRGPGTTFLFLYFLPTFQVPRIRTEKAEPCPPSQISHYSQVQRL